MRQRGCVRVWPATLIIRGQTWQVPIDWRWLDSLPASRRLFDGRPHIVQPAVQKPVHTFKMYAFRLRISSIGNCDL